MEVVSDEVQADVARINDGATLPDAVVDGAVVACENVVVDSGSVVVVVGGGGGGHVVLGDCDVSCDKSVSDDDKFVDASNSHSKCKQ